MQILQIQTIKIIYFQQKKIFKILYMNLKSKNHKVYLLNLKKIMKNKK